ncbi:MAG: LacI family DNA-binding transcriptional regulator [Eubacteriales bacterium]|nr:LacI family DNA-binding transcriptional regulator [Eubacteriales bacterium]
MATSSRITIDEIAREAGVSIATVSRIINRKGNTREETRQKVLAAMERLGYSFSPQNLLCDAQSNTILVCVPDFRNPFNGVIIDGIQSAAVRRGYHVLVMQAGDVYTTFDDYQMLLKNNAIAGLLLMHQTSPQIVEELSLRCPVVMCSEICDGSAVSYVSIDNYASARTATNYLLSINRRRMAMINSSLTYHYARQREQGFLDTLAQAGLRCPREFLVHLSDISFEQALASATHMLSGKERPDAFFAVSDVFAAAAVKAAKRHNLQVPQDVAVIGFDNIDISLMTDPAITTIQQPTYQMGSQACSLLLDKIGNPALPAQQILLETELIVRASTL